MVNIGIFCCCGELANPCANDDPPLEVTISWPGGSPPTGNSGWEATTAGKLDMFGETWSNAETKLICPTNYNYYNNASSVSAGWQFIGLGTPAASNIFFGERFAGTTASYYNIFEEDLNTPDGASVNVVRFTNNGTTTLGNTLNSASLSTLSGVGLAEASANLGAPISFGAFGGQLTTTGNITVVWQKTAFFPTGAP